MVVGCVFCEIVGDPYKSVDEGNAIMSFEPLDPVTPGHRLFVPLEHLHDATAWPYRTGDAFAAAARYAEKQGEAFNLITSARAEATQTIFHLHVHYVPRREGDGLHLPWTGQKQ